MEKGIFWFLFEMFIEKERINLKRERGKEKHKWTERKTEQDFK